ncbi:MAG: hypothetical protein KBG15_10405 [Kofleriaceae bacterium]|nr:hypothetical protein [Kofleriaceae bacterium]
MRPRFGLLGPLLVIVGLLAGGFGIWFMLHVRPVPGPFIDGFALDDDSYIAIRAQSGTDRNFVEATRQNKKLWQAMIPHYAGRVGAPAIGVSPTAMTVRIARRGRSEVFGLSLTDARKMGALLLGKDRKPTATSHCGEIITLTADGQAFELLSTEDGNAIASVYVSTGAAGWQAQLDKAPITDAGVANGIVWINQGTTSTAFHAADGSSAQIPAEARSADRHAAIRVLAPGISFETTSRRLIFSSANGPPTMRAWPSDAVDPWPYHIGNTTILVIRPTGISHLPLTAEMPLAAVTANAPAATNQ